MSTIRRFEPGRLPADPRTLKQRAEHAPRVETVEKKRCHEMEHNWTRVKPVVEVYTCKHCGAMLKLDGETGRIIKEPEDAEGTQQ